MNELRISVRNLVEFILRSGDLSVSSRGLKDPDAMQEGTRIHKKLQKRMGPGYQAEVPLSITLPHIKDEIEFNITVEGRADGIFTEDSVITIDEIKGVYRDIHSLTEPIEIHRAQALCYAYIYATQEELDGMGIRITYCHIPTEEVRYFREYLNYASIQKWFFNLIDEYSKWIVWQIKWHEKRNQSIKQLDFPFTYREGQKNIVKGVYQSILRRKRLYIEAPTGVGKTISTVFPAVKSIGENLTEKIFYLTAKTITRTVAEDTFALLEEKQTLLKCVTITAKEKICLLEKPNCNPEICERAKGHFDRVNDAVYDVLTHETMITRDIILEYSQKHQVCPFEMCLDITTWADVIIGDYNYAFDPTSSLKRFFSIEKENDYVFLVDEAHNLVDRAREMYSASLQKEDFLELKKMIKPKSRKISNALEQCNHALLECKRKCDSVQKFTSLEIEGFILRLMRLCTLLEEYFQKDSTDKHQDSTPLLPDEKDKLLNFYFDARNFQNIYEILDDCYTIYGDYSEDGGFWLHLQCMDPSVNLDSYLKKARCSVFFSATFLPIHYYRGQLAGREEDYAIYAPSPFQSSKRLLMIGQDVSTKYTRRSPEMYEKISEYIFKFVQGKVGNYMVFFPSYRMLEEIQKYIVQKNGHNKIQILSQNTSMDETEREEFLSHFQESPTTTTLGLCIMGGIFGEGIDLKGSRLIGAVIVGTGLPMVCTQNELFKEYFDQSKNTGFSYAYQYPGMNKVLQAAGRVIRTTNDIGSILLLDDRFLQPSYQKLFPREWYPYEVVTSENICMCLKHFWQLQTEKND